MSPGAEAKSPSRTYTCDAPAFGLMSGLFFVCGFITCLNDILIPRLKAAFDLGYARVMLVQLMFFAASFLMSPPAGVAVTRLGYKRSTIAGLVIAASGLACMWPAADMRSYAAFLGALFIAASGLTLLQVIINPYVTFLGPPEKSASRLTLAQALSSVGTFLAPFFGGLFILSNAAQPPPLPLSRAALSLYRLRQADVVKGPYLGIAVFLLLLALLVLFTRLPELQQEGEAAERGGFRQALTHRPLQFGIAAIFCYVGAEVSIGSFMINYLGLPDIGHLAPPRATMFVALYWGGAMSGRMLGAGVMARLSPRKILAVFAMINIALLAATICFTGAAAAAPVVSIGIFNSVMFPTIFTLSVDGTGRSAGKASSMLIMAEIGGAIVPYLQGVLADRVGLQLSYLLPLACYAYIFLFSAYGSKPSPVSTVS